ncbi:aspartyl protease family protein [Candidatus Methylacidiphilum infernorum]|uniref:Aspartyl protease family protein n=1 Tax=Candidatus Methylacidiphilum infernorum TaxID=511746 RepID=A0ABX7PTF3_9BACT|nr:aspartyl protease family protein [Candidatus Methylacidiphilum infernorum]QSR86023.1 aspartyl protease family protein [Candidatus Methylacidiphilum infernorum]
MNPRKKHYLLSNRSAEKLGIGLYLFKFFREIIAFSLSAIFLVLSFCPDFCTIQAKSTSAITEQKRAKDYKDKALHAIYHNRNAIAIRYLKKSLSLFAEDPQISELLALAYLREDKVKEAVLWLERSKQGDVASFYREIGHPFQQTASYKSVRLAIVDSPYPFYPLVEVNIKGRSFLFLVDTGSSTSLVDKQLAQEIGVQGRSPLKLVLSSGNKTQGLLCAIESISLGPLFVKNVPALIVSQLHQKPYARGYNFQGVLGMDLLSRFNLLIDYPNRVINLLKKDIAAEDIVAKGSKMVAEIPFFLNPQGLIFLKGKCRLKEFLFLFDTGSRDYPMEFSKELVQALKPSQGSLDDPLSCVTLGCLQIKGLRGDSTPLSLEMPTLEKIPFGGIIGNSLLHRYKLFFDFQRMVLRLFL